MPTFIQALRQLGFKLERFASEGNFMIRSSWISRILFSHGFLAVFTKYGDALLYGPSVPSYVPGLLAAGTGRRSVGLAFNRLLKGKHSYQKIEDAGQVRELRRMMEGGVQ